MLHQTLPILGQLWQLFEVSQILEFLLYKCETTEMKCHMFSPISMKRAVRGQQSAPNGSLILTVA